jgi:hypothetical protein
MEVKKVYELLKSRIINPSGCFDGAGRFYLEHSDLVSVRSPSRLWPYTQMNAGRTLKYVKAVAKKFDCGHDFELLKSKV